jgi:pro-kumamolisin-like protein
MRAMFASSTLLLCLVLVVSFGVSAGAQSSDTPPIIGQPRPLVTDAVEESRLATLKGNIHPLARPEFDLGTADGSLPMKRMLLVLKRSDAQETAMRKLLDDQQDKHSPNYHRWLTPEKFGQQFGPTEMMRGSCLLLLAAGTMAVASCGGGGHSSTPPPPPPNPGTPAGTYNIVVTATSGLTVSATGFTLVVQ